MPTDNFKNGDFVEKDKGGAMSFGVVITGGNGFVHLQEGPAGPNIEYDKILHTYLKKLNSPTEQMESIEKERRQGILQASLILKSIKDKTSWAMSRIEGKPFQIEKPNTGIFAVIGVYKVHGAQQVYISVVSADPSMSEEAVSIKLKDKYPNGFGNIPIQSHAKSSSDDHEKLYCYNCCELPKQAADLIDWELEKI